MDFFIGQVTLSAYSLGFDTADVATYKNTLDSLFNTRCAPATAVPGIKAAPEPQSICIAENCPLDSSADCAAYPDDDIAVAPKNATATFNSTTLSRNTSATASVTATSAGLSDVKDGESVMGLVFELAMLVAVFMIW
jgi:hypothetical protein